MGRVEIIMQTLEDMFPGAHCELYHGNALELLIAVMLSAQSTDAAVNRVTRTLFSKYQELEDYINTPLETLQEDIRKLGLYRNKAKNIKAAALIIKMEHGGKVPASQEALEALPGVGRKTANVVRSVWFDVPRIAVDTHVERVAKRLKLAYNNDTPRKVEEKLMRKLPKERWSKAHHQMIFFGRYHCTSRHPNCQKCPLIAWCRYPRI